MYRGTRRELAKRWWLGLVGGVALLLIGCGGTTSDNARVRMVVQGYRAALLDRNGSELCSLLSIQAQRDLAALVKAPTGRKGSCAIFARTLFSAFGHDVQATAGIRAARVGTVKVTGDKATVVVREPGASAREITLAKNDGEWKITLPPPGASPSFDVRGGPAAITVEPPPTVVHGGGEKLSHFYLGRTVVAQSGCLACHRIGEAGNAGPGPDLTHVGSKLPPNAIERAIINPTAPMPSFRNLPKAKLKALVVFLSLLR